VLAVSSSESDRDLRRRLDVRDERARSVSFYR